VAPVVSPKPQADPVQDPSPESKAQQSTSFRSPGCEQKPEEWDAGAWLSCSVLSAQRLFGVPQRIILIAEFEFRGKGRVGRMTPAIGKVARVPDLEATGTATV
jgi:hypothetical protein